MQYSLMLHQTPAQFAARDEANTQAFGRFVGTMQEAGVLLVLLGLEAAETARTVRGDNSGPRVEVGAFAAADAQLGGICVIEAPDLAAAVAWARRAPLDRVAAIEVRPTRLVPLK
jgi:hypothetical protein